MIGCGSLSNGYAVYTCDHCNNYMYVPFTCKSRFCSSCCTKYVLDRPDTIARKAINCPHRHITFTIHQDLWSLFQKHRSLLNLLFNSVSSTILSWFYDQNHKENFNPGFISTLHTFGHAPKVKSRDIKATVKYVIRYSGKPAMAQSHILNYDGEFVTFWYDRHEDNKRVEEKIHAYDFIKRLIIHIYDKYFNVVRYYGLYARKYKHSNKLFTMMKPHVASLRKRLANWKCRIELYFKHNPLSCPCGHTFHFDYLVLKEYNSS